MLAAAVPAGRDAVLVVGAGPTGLTVAIELARRHVPCRIVDRLREPLSWERATAIQPRTLELLEDFGLVDQFLDRGLRQPTIAFYAGGRRISELSLAGLETTYPFVLGIDEATTERLLEDHLRSLGVEVERGSEVRELELDGDRVAATIVRNGQAELVEPDWLVSCEGAGSSVRHALGDPFKGFAYPRTSFAADVRFDGWPYSENEITSVLGADVFGAQAVAPGLFRVWFLLERDQEPEEVDLEGIVARNVGEGVTVVEDAQRSTFTLHNRMAERFRFGRAFLAGDAGHVTSSSSSMGLNTGMHDAGNLAWKLAAVVDGATPGMLDTYDDERSGAASRLLEWDRELVRSLTVTDPDDRYRRDRLVAIGNADPADMATAAAEFADLAVAYNPGPLAAGEPAGGDSWPGLAPGARVPDLGPLVGADRAVTSLYDLLRGTHHQLLLLSGGRPEAAALAASELLPVCSERAGVEVRLAVVVPGGVGSAPLPAELVVLDQDWTVHDRLGAVGAELFAIRPDGYLGLRSETPLGSDVRDYLDLVRPPGS